MLKFIKKIAGNIVRKCGFLWVKNLQRNFPYILRLRLCLAYKKNTFCFVIDPNIKHPGLADRMKAMIDCYNIAKLNGYDFRIVFKTPFRLEDYLQPNAVDWVAEYTDLNYSLKGTRFFNELNFLKEDSWKGRKKLSKNKENHCYSYVGNRQPKMFPQRTQNTMGQSGDAVFDEHYASFRNVAKNNLRRILRVLLPNIWF